MPAATHRLKRRFKSAGERWHVEKNESTLSWYPPVPKPIESPLYEWNEEAGDWTVIEIPIPDDYDPATDPLMIEWLANAEQSTPTDN